MISKPIPNASKTGVWPWLKTGSIISSKYPCEARFCQTMVSGRKANSYSIKGELIERIKNNVDNSHQAIDLILVSKYFERIGDHATNIAEWVVFLLTGMHKDSKIL